MDSFLDGILRTLKELDSDERVWLGLVLFNPEDPPK